MNRFAIRLLLAFAACIALTGNATASGTCSITSVTLASQTYNGTAIAVTGAVNWTCTRTSGGTDGTPTTFVVTADPGGNPSGATRQAAATGLFVPYGLNIGGVAWGDGVSGQGNGTTVTANFAGSSTTVSGTFNFNFTVAGGLLPLVGRTYTDSVTVGGTCTTKKNSGCTVTTNTLPVSITVNTSCTMTSSPAGFSLPYSAFQATAAQANSSFGVNCSNGAAYRMSVSPSSATAAGINYTLTLGTAANNPTDVSSTTTYNLAGTGLNITYWVNANAASGQPGTCATASCTVSTPHTLTLEY